MRFGSSESTQTLANIWGSGSIVLSHPQVAGWIGPYVCCDSDAVGGDVAVSDVTLQGALSVRTRAADVTIRRVDVTALPNGAGGIEQLDGTIGSVVIEDNTLDNTPNGIKITAVKRHPSFEKIL